MSYKRISPIPVIEGGTQVKTWTTAYGLLCAGTTVTNPIQTLASLGATSTILTSQGASSLPTWTTAVYPATTTINQILWSSAANNIVGLATANSSVLITSSLGVPSLSQTLPNAVQTNITAVGALAAGSLTTGFSVVPLAIGGTNANLTAANGGIFYSTATAGAILAATATANQVLLSGSNTTPAWSSAAYPASTTINQILYSSSNNVITGLATANQAVLTTGTGGVPVLTAIATNGQLIIGSTAGAPAAATLSAGSGISITNGSNSITIAATTGSLTWTTVTGATQAMVAANGYVTDKSAGVTYTLPASGTLGDTIMVVGQLGLSTIDQNANQQILIGSDSSTVGTGGSIAGTNVGDCVQIVCITAGSSTVWRATSIIGNWTTT
jgi:hypothetical protein